MATQIDRSKVDQGVELIDSMTDEELNLLVDYVRHSLKGRAARRNALAQLELSIGTRVRLAGQYKPQYLTGMTGTVVEKKNTRVVVKLDNGPVGKFKSGKVVTSPGGLEVIR